MISSSILSSAYFARRNPRMASGGPGLTETLVADVKVTTDRQR